MKTRTFSCSVVATFPVPKDVLFRALTDAKTLAAWSGQRAKVTPVIGGSFSMFDGWVKGVVLAFERDKVVSYTWKPDDWGARTVASVVTCTLSGRGKSSSLRIRHKSLPTAAQAADHKKGWKEFVVEPLSAYLKESM